MPFQLTPYTVPLLLATLLGVTTAAAVWLKSDSKTEKWSAVVLAGVSAWSFLNLLVVSSTALETKLMWFRVFLAAALAVPMAMTVFTYHFTGRGQKVRKKLIPVFASIYLPFTALLAFKHELIIVDPHLEATGEFVELNYSWGLLGWVSISVGYVITAYYLYLLFQKFLRSRNIYRKVTFAILFSVSLMAIGSLTSFLGLSPFPHMMLLPFTFLVLGGILVVTTSSVKVARMIPVDKLLAVLGSRFENLAPLARDFVVEEIDNGVVVLDKKDRIVDINPAARNILDADNCIGKKIQDVAASQSLLDVVERTGEHGVVRDEVHVDAEDGRRCYDVSVSDLMNGGEKSGSVLLIHDITKQKGREEELRRREQDLRRQKNKLEHQNERLDRFASIVSHDLRNPLNVAEGYAGMIYDELETHGDEAVIDKDEVGKILDSHERMSNIIDDALTLAREGKAITETESVKLGDAAMEAWDNVELGDAELRIGEDVSIEADRNRLLNVLENLFRNSREHGGEDVIVEVGKLNDNGFYVEDDGVGVPDDEKDDILDHGYTTSEEGTGLGLSIVTTVANAHGWTMTITDSSEGGLRFEFTDVETERTPKLTP